MRHTSLALLTVCLLAPTPTLSQNSIFGVHGIGYPGRPVSARVHALGGGPAMFDARSALNPASVTGLARLTVSASSGTSLRRFTALDTVVEGLQETRFPYALLGASLRGTPVSLALSYSNYAERSYDQITFDSITVRGEDIAVVDQITSDGAVTDIRGALGWRLDRRVHVGGAVHVLSGSQKLQLTREFDSSFYYPVSDLNRIGFSGFGMSAGLLVNPTSSFSLGASVRSDSKLKSSLDSTEVDAVDLPLSYAAGVYLQLNPSIRWSATAERKQWSSVEDDLDAPNSANAFDTWAVGSGIELGSSSGTPLRVGARYAQLPFSPVAEQASELVFSAGTALIFAGGRASIDASAERIARDGAGAKERGWYLMFALTVMP